MTKDYFVDKYFNNTNFLGILTVDGGWGINYRVQEIASKLDIKIEPVCVVNNLGDVFNYNLPSVLNPQNLDYISSDTAGASANESLYHYKIKTNIQGLNTLHIFLEALRKAAGEKIICKLRPLTVQVGDPVYELKLEVSPNTSNKVAYNILQGQWERSFTDTKLIAGFTNEDFNNGPNS